MEKNRKNPEILPPLRVSRPLEDLLIQSQRGTAHQVEIALEDGDDGETHYVTWNPLRRALTSRREGFYSKTEEQSLVKIDEIFTRAKAEWDKKMAESNEIDIIEMHQILQTALTEAKLIIIALDRETDKHFAAKSVLFEKMLHDVQETMAEEITSLLNQCLAQFIKASELQKTNPWKNPPQYISARTRMLQSYQRVSALLSSYRKAMENKNMGNRKLIQPLPPVFIPIVIQLSQLKEAIEKNFQVKL